MKEYRIEFPQYQREVFALPGTSLFECAMRAGIQLRTPCSGAGTCGKCRIRIIKGDLPPTEQCRKLLPEKEIANGIRLACRNRVSGDLIIEIPTESLFEQEINVLQTGDDAPTAASEAKQAIVKKDFIQLPGPTLESPDADLENLRSTLGIPQLSLTLGQIQQLPETLRKKNFAVTATVAGNRLISVDSGHDSSANFAIAVDLGTTTIAVALLDLVSGKTIDTGGCLNPQVRFGDDVVNRICRQNESMEQSRELQALAVGAVNELTAKLCRKCKINPGQITAVGLAGNTVMECLFAGIPAGSMGEIPFAPPFKHTLHLTANELGINIHPEAEAVLFPVIGGFVGGDIVAGLMASSLADSQKPVLFIDVGTNGEIVLHTGNEMLATAAAAGPAFEGAGIEYGMRAAPGAIEKVIFESEIICNVIGNQQPQGICGTALIDAAAEMLRCGMLDMTGRILNPEECPEKLPPALRQSLVPNDDGNTFDLQLSAESGRPVFLRQKDIRQLQLASGAIAAAVKILLAEAGLQADDLSAILLAGGFGSYIRRTHAKRIGMIPDLPDEHIRFIGNTSLLGVKQGILNHKAMTLADQIASKVRFVDVSLNPMFQMEFAEAMLFPENIRHG